MHNVMAVGQFNQIFEVLINNKDRQTISANAIEGPQIFSELTGRDLQSPHPKSSISDWS